MGCGDFISIWANAWLSSIKQPKIQSLVINGLQEAPVSALIDPVSKCWDKDILNGYFVPQEVDMILSIVLYCSHVEEKLIWPHVSSRIYSVKSGYNF